jgi:hypothetical protein
MPPRRTPLRITLSVTDLRELTGLIELLLALADGVERASGHRDARKALLAAAKHRELLTRLAAATGQPERYGWSDPTLAANLYNLLARGDRLAAEREAPGD